MLDDACPHAQFEDASPDHDQAKPTRLPSLHKLFPEMYFNRTANPSTSHREKFLQRPSTCLDLHTIHHYATPIISHPPHTFQQSPGYDARIPSQLPHSPYALLLASPPQSTPSHASENPLRTSYVHRTFSASPEGSEYSADDGYDQWCDTERRHVCAQCQKRFDRPSSLRTHENTHTGVKPYCCPFPSCGQFFNVKSNMRRHIRTHSPARRLRRSRRADDTGLDLSHSLTFTQAARTAQHIQRTHTRRALHPSDPVYAHMVKSSLPGHSFAHCSVINPTI